VEIPAPFIGRLVEVHAVRRICIRCRRYTSTTEFNASKVWAFLIRIAISESSLTASWICWVTPFVGFTAMLTVPTRPVALPCEPGFG
jgi:hypothetical protein